MLAGAARGRTGSKGGGGPVRSSDVDTQDISVILAVSKSSLYLLIRKC